MRLAGRASRALACTLAAATTLLAGVVAAQELAIEDGKLQAINAAGIAEGSIEFSSSSPATPSPKVLDLSSESTLKLTYSLPTSLSLSSVSLSFVIFSTLSPNVLASSLASPSNTSTDELAMFRHANSQYSSVSIPLSAKKGGKYRWEWDLANPSSNSNRKEEILTLARKTDGRMKAQVLLAASDPSVKSILLDIGTVYIKDEAYWREESAAKKKWPREWEMDRYSVRKELAWTFGEKRSGIGAAKTVIGIALVLAPWAILAIFVPTIASSFHFAPSGLSSLFLVSLLSLDGIILSYWFSAINAWQFMPLAGIAGILSALIGKSALSERNAARSSREVRKKFEAAGAASQSGNAKSE